MYCSSAIIKIISILVVFSFIGCAASSYRRVDAESVIVKANDKGVVPAGLVEDAMRIESVPLFDDTTYTRIENAVSSSKDLASAQTKIRDAICDGTKPRSQPKLTVHLILNRPMKGEALDIASERNRLFINQAKIYLKQYWLDEGSRTDLISQKYNTDFQAYQENIVETNMERKSASSRVCLGVPFIQGNTTESAKKYFKQSHATPNLPPIEQTGPTQWFPSKSFLSLAYPNHTFILSNKVSDFVIAVWGHENYGTEMNVDIVHDQQLGKTTSFGCFGISDGYNYRNSAHYKPSPNSWKLKDESVANPIVMIYLDDLAVLKSEFVFKIPKEDLERLFGITSSDDLKYFGYNFDTGKFAASVALENQSYAWSQILANQTEVSQTSQEDASVTFEVKPSLEAFCKWAIPASSLVAQ